MYSIGSRFGDKRTICSISSTPKNCLIRICIHIERNGRKANAKSIMSLMMLAAAKGSLITLICNGEDEEQAQQKIIELFAGRFGEAE